MKFRLLIKIEMLKNKNSLFILLINVKMPRIGGILTFMSRINFMLSLVEHEHEICNIHEYQNTNKCGIFLLTLDNVI